MQEPLLEIKKKAEVLKVELEKIGFKVSSIYLFGSYAKGDWLKTSDIDLAVVSDDFRSLKFLERLDIVNKIIWDKRIGNVEILPLTREEVEKNESIVLRDAKKYWLKLI
ncbi:MAG: nucleotidyltransferase domain-containing protein [Archaeoglobaceae archaeon]|nr:nucleotidyltransferase domain-containing protein [Archaeoglobaceae archaeon]MDW8117416.1 nucleotidyltransferase domain-containing protein [Archaeoglobaceae archaeon]